MKLYCLLRFVFSVDLAFIKIATGVSARAIFTLECFLLLRRRAFRKQASGKNLIPALVSGPRFLTIYLLSLLGTFKFVHLYICVHLNLDAVSHKLKRKRKYTHKNECFNMEYLKLMTKHFKKAFYPLYWILQLLINPIHQILTDELIDWIACNSCKGWWHTYCTDVSNDPVLGLMWTLKETFLFLSLILFSQSIFCESFLTMILFSVFCFCISWDISSGTVFWHYFTETYFGRRNVSERAHFGIS